MPLASGTASLLTVLIALACPLMMIFRMRGREHGRAGQARKSLDELRRERDELNEEIAQRAEQAVHSHE